MAREAATLPLTPEERRRTFLARQDASRQILAQTFQPISVTESPALALAFRVPSSAVEALLPRL